MVQLLSSTANFSINNVVNNSSPQGYGIFYVSSGSLYIFKCIFYNNFDKLFHGNIFVYDSWINHETNFIGSSLIYQNNNNNFTLTNSYHFFLIQNDDCLFNRTQKKNMNFLPSIFLYILVGYFTF